MMKNFLTGLAAFMGGRGNSVMPSVGDTTNLTLLIVLLAASAVGIILLIILLVRKKYNGKYNKEK